MASPLSPNAPWAQHDDADCAGTWVFGFRDCGGEAVPAYARCTRCPAVHEFASPADAEPYKREAQLHAHLLAGRV